MYTGFDIGINRKAWSAFTDEELERFAADVFRHYRGTGFPYMPDDAVFRRRELEKFIEYPYMDLLDGDVIKQSMHGLAFCWSYMPHAYAVRCNGMRSPLETFEDDRLFMDVVRRRIRMGDTVTPNGIRKMLKIYTGTQCVSNFRPTAAAVIYGLFGRGKTVWDMSCGYGGRMLGAMRAGVGRYIGTEPCSETYDGLTRMLSDFPGTFGRTEFEIHKTGSEDYVPEPGSLDLCFTSPPYFDTERYSDEETQSWKRYPTKEEWMGVFMRRTLENCFAGLKEGGVLALNIAGVRSYPDIEEDTVRTAESAGFVRNAVLKYSLSSLSSSKVYKHEPVYLFTKGAAGKPLVERKANKLF